MNRIERIDEQLLNCHITIDYNHIKRLLTIMLVIINSQVVLMALISYLTFDIESIWWYGIYIPLILNPVAKLWFIAFVEGIRQRFDAINAYLDNLRVKILNEKKKGSSAATSNVGIPSGKQLWRRAAGNTQVVAALGTGRKLRENYISNDFVHKLIAAATDRTGKKTDGVKYVRPAMNPMATDNDLDVKYWNTADATWAIPLRSSLALPSVPIHMTTRPANSSAIIDDKLDCELSTLCFLHDDICDIGKVINQMFSFQMLILMAYGFMAITAQLYFVYCGLVGQVRQSHGYIYRILLNSNASINHIILSTLNQITVDSSAVSIR